MSDHLVRVEQLRRLQAERGWSDADLARHCKRNPQQLRAWWVYPGPGGRQIGEKLARSLEEELELPRYSLDQRPGMPPNLPAREGSRGRGVATPVTMAPAAQQGTPVPILSWEQLSDMLTISNAEIEAGTPHLDTFAPASSTAKFVAMPDDSMEPVFTEGDHVLFDPAQTPRAGDTILVKLGSGDHFIRVYRPRTAHAWEAAPLNENYQGISSSEDHAVIVAVMVEHRRYRRR